MWCSTCSILAVLLCTTLGQAQSPAYRETANGEWLCPSGYEGIADQAECQTAAIALGKTWGFQSSWPNYQLGCFTASNGNTVWFNTNQAGTAHISFKSICKQAPSRCACESPGHSSFSSCTLSSTCSCNGKARLGYGTRWSSWKEVSGSIQCTNSNFGGDPAFGQAKECQCDEVASQVPKHRYDKSCWTAGSDVASRDASCAGDLVCARNGFDGRSFGDCGNEHCCSQPECKDEYTGYGSCGMWVAWIGCSGHWSQWMSLNCKASCGLCSKADLLPIGSTVALHSRLFNRFVTMNSDLGFTLRATAMRDADALPSFWNRERFQVVDAGNGEIALHSTLFNRFVTMNSDLGFTLMGTSMRAAHQLPSFWVRERFQVVDAGNGEIALHSRHFNRFVTMNSDLGFRLMSTSMRAAHQLPSSWIRERFQVVPVQARRLEAAGMVSV